NCVRAIARRTPRRDVALFAVGRQTAAAARAARFARVRSADGDGANLARAASGWVKPRGGDLLHAAGADTRGDLAATLRENGFTVRTEVLYEARAVAALPAAAAKALGEESVDAVLLFSPRGARIFGELAGKAGLRCAMVTAVCISQQTAAALANVQFRAIEVAARPDQDALLARLDRLGPRL
ncbi:MAG: uroporphyrinogen-III synthase, partial [Rhizomicrobium sp.]